MPESKRDLLLLCNSFPYGTGETFLANEFPYLEKSFNRIVIVARTSNPQQTKQVAKNVTVFALSPQSKLIDKIKLPFLFLSNKKQIKSLIQNERESIRQIFGSRPSRKQVQTYWHDALKALEIKDFLKQKALPLLGEDAVIYSYWQNSAALAGVLLKLENPSFKSICRTHGADLYLYRQKSKYLSFRKFLSENLDNLFFISNDGLQYQQKLLGQTFNSFSLSFLGTDKIKERFSKKKSNSKIIVSCSNLVPLKRVHLIIQALSFISDTDLEWIHFGSGVLKEEIENTASSLFYNKPNIKFDLKGHVPNEMLHQFYAENEVDLFINVSEFEGVPVSIMEAMSYGIPVMATDVGGVKEIVKKENGILLKKEITSKDLYEAISYFLVSSNESDFRENALRHWERNYCASNNYANFVESIYEL